MDKNVFTFLPSILIWVCAMFYYYLFNFIGSLFFFSFSVVFLWFFFHHCRNHSVSIVHIFFFIPRFFFFKFSLLCIFFELCFVLLLIRLLCQKKQWKRNCMKENENELFSLVHTLHTYTRKVAPYESARFQEQT